LTSTLAEILQRGVDEGAFPGAVGAVVDGDQVTTRVVVGNRVVEPRVLPMNASTLFDLASLTKPLVAAPSVLLLAHDGALSLDDPVVAHMPEYGDGEPTVRHLLTHTSGLPAWKPLYRDVENPPKVVSHIGSLAKERPVGARVVYSCLGYIVLGRLVERLSGVSLSQFAEDRLLSRLRMRRTAYNPPEAWREDCAATESEEGAAARGQTFARPDRVDGVLCGTVHDENARFLGGVSANAGLFSTADDLAIYAGCLLSGGSPVFPPEVYHGLVDVVVDDGETRRTLGWIALQDGTLTHTGFTGTAFRWHPKRRRAAILLTNRIHPNALNPAIQDFRAEWFSAVFS